MSTAQGGAMLSHSKKPWIGLTTTVYTGHRAHVHIALDGKTLGIVHRLPTGGFYVADLRGAVSSAPTLRGAVAELLEWHAADARRAVRGAKTPARLEAARRRLSRLLEVAPWWM